MAIRPIVIPNMTQPIIFISFELKSIRNIHEIMMIAMTIISLEIDRNQEEMFALLGFFRPTERFR